MSKKVLVIFSVILTCICLGILVRNLQNNILKKTYSNAAIQNQNSSSSNEEQKNQEEKNQTELNKTAEQALKDSGNNAKNSEGNASTDATPQKTVPPSTPKQNKTNFIVIDTVKNKTLYSGYVDYNGESLEKLTTVVLGEDNYDLDNGYFKAIYGLRERAAGNTSGWCFYINNVKSGVGARSYIPSKNDVIVWKYLKDGLSN